MALPHLLLFDSKVHVSKLWNAMKQMYLNNIRSGMQAISVAAEAKREEEKEKGDNPDSGCENPDIVPFEDNEEAEEESEEEETFGHPLGAAAQGRGRGRGIMGPPHIPISRGARPIPDMRYLSQ